MHSSIENIKEHQRCVGSSVDKKAICAEQIQEGLHSLVSPKKHLTSALLNGLVVSSGSFECIVVEASEVSASEKASCRDQDVCNSENKHKISGQ